MGFVEIFVVLVMMVMLAVYLRQHYGEVEYVRSASDNREYLVQNMENKSEAADRLAAATDSMRRLTIHMVAKFPDNPDAQRLYKNYDPDAVSEGSADSGYTSYSVNKGEKIILCIRQKDRTFVDHNTLLYVAIHELGHLMTDEIGHTDKFWSNFRFLLQEAIDIKLYEPADYNAVPQDYCGIKINSSIV
ncbi:hypothetical protein FOA52_000265 [Chlamydomonas sp. UWO 241]|nr:hypothetical protein FOA52_000265 [Chlamydomonas sp. UWO 241]